LVFLVKSSLALLPEIKKVIEEDPALAKNVRILGHCENLSEVLRAFDVGVIGSTSSEANCRVGLEWMASGVPLVATKVGVLPDIVEEGETGYLVTPDEASEMTEKLLKLSLNLEKKCAMGVAARKRVVDHFTLGKNAESFMKLIEAIKSEK
jgi:glycosyltransferase involved in cell wall biosynthesis